MASGSWSALLFAETTSESHRGDHDGMRAHTGPIVAGWAPVLASPNLRHAFALISDEVDASLSGIRLTILVRPDSELARVLVWRLYEYMPQLVLVSEPVTSGSSRPALHRAPKVSNAFIKKLAFFTLWCPFCTANSHGGIFTTRSRASDRLFSVALSPSGPLRIHLWLVTNLKVQSTELYPLAWLYQKELEI